MCNNGRRTTQLDITTKITVLHQVMQSTAQYDGGQNSRWDKTQNPVIGDGCESLSRSALRINLFAGKQQMQHTFENKVHGKGPDNGIQIKVTNSQAVDTANKYSCDDGGGESGGQTVGQKENGGKSGSGNGSVGGKAGGEPDGLV